MNAMDQDILIGLVKNKNAYNKIIREFPGLYTASLTIQQNLSKENVEKAAAKLVHFYNTNDKFKSFVRTLQNENNTSTNNNLSASGENVAGLIVILDKKEESYKRLMETAKKEQWQYKGIAIVDQFENMRLYFY